MKNTRFLHVPSGVVFENRKQCLIVMGQNRYNRALANREFIFDYTENDK